MLFGAADRRLFGLLHAHAGQDPARGSMLLCAPLLQEGIRSHRALWAVAESVAAAGAAALCFDWYGSGDSAGDDDEVSLPGMLADLDSARRLLATAPGGDCITWLALRSAALPMLAYLSQQAHPVNVVLWDPQLVGKGVVESWRRQHQAQLYDSGRYAHARHEPDGTDLLGFCVDAQLLAALAALDATATALPPGSRVRLALWQGDDDRNGANDITRFIRTQREHSVEVDVFELDAADRPGWEDPKQFGSQAYPRRSVAQLGQYLAATEAG
ncbi:MAG TPA: hypothetical protein VIT90_05510 [Lysobacter sp.]